MSLKNVGFSYVKKYSRWYIVRAHSAAIRPQAARNSQSIRVEIVSPLPNVSTVISANIYNNDKVWIVLQWKGFQYVIKGMTVSDTISSRHTCTYNV